MKDFKLRDYQQELIDNTLESYKRGINRQLAVSFTGSGKTITAISLIKKFTSDNKNVIILVDQEDLVWQWQKRIQSFAPEIIPQIEKAEFKAKKTANVVIASVQSLGRKGNKRIKKFKNTHFDLCLVDEGHKSITPTFIRVLEYLGFGKENFVDGNLLWACTATPWRESGESMGILYDDIVGNYDIRYGISQGWLTDIELYDVQTTTDISKVRTNRSDFTISHLSETINTDARNKEMLKAYKQYADDEQAIIYCADVQHAYDVSKLFNDNDIRCETIEANTQKQERKEWIKEFEEGKIKVLANFGTLTTGIDFPELRALIFGRPIKSKLLFTQCLGRVLRPSESATIDNYDDPDTRKTAIELSNKPVAKVIDMCDKAGSHNVVHIPSLFGLHDKLQPKEPKKFFKEVVEPLDRLKKEKQVDVSQITDLDQIEIIAKKRSYEIKSLQLSPEVSSFTNRDWSETTNGYEVIYNDDNKILIIEPDSTHDELLNQSRWNLLEYDTQSKVTKNLQTFNSLSGAFKVGDEYADQQKWTKPYNKKGDWWDDPVTQSQLKWLNRFYRYGSGYAEFETLKDRYDNGVPKIRWKSSKFGVEKGTILNKKLASKLLNQKFGKK